MLANKSVNPFVPNGVMTDEMFLDAIDEIPLQLPVKKTGLSVLISRTRICSVSDEDPEITKLPKFPHPTQSGELVRINVIVKFLPTARRTRHPVYYVGCILREADIDDAKGWEIQCLRRNGSKKGQFVYPPISNISVGTHDDTSCKHLKLSTSSITSVMILGFTALVYVRSIIIIYRLFKSCLKHNFTLIDCYDFCV